ncbi:MAG: glycerophosphodiester phosphodiesterase family protein [Anaerolineales bacterium]|jgi:glycerophosphoryl diester phosphodiesterase
MLFDLSTPLIIAHRGASAHAPENTLAAFRLAQEQGAEGVELDVHLSADGQVVVIHDNDISRTTNGRGLVHNLTLSEIRRLDAGQGETVPTLDEVLDLIKDRILINIELKGFSSTARALPEEVLTLVQGSGLGDKIIYSSFDPRMLLRIRRRTPEAKTGLLLLPGALGTLFRVILTTMARPTSLHPHYSAVNPAFIRRAHRKRRAVVCYTVNEPEDIRRLDALGVDGIITDDPALARQTREAAR